MGKENRLYSGQVSSRNTSLVAKNHHKIPNNKRNRRKDEKSSDESNYDFDLET